MDERALTALAARIRSGAIRDLHSLVVVRHGYVVQEEYFNGSRRDDVHTMQSVTKSITSLMVGIAVDQGKLRANDPVLAFFPGYTDLRNVDERKRAVTVRDLLTMTSGIDFYESPYAGSPLQLLNDSRDDWVRYVLERPMNDVPGGHWQYNSGGVIVLAGVLRSATGLSADAFARTHLFQPIGIATERWVTSPFDGTPHTGGGLNLRALDLARLGYLALRDGRWNDRQIVSTRWLAESLTPVVVRPRTFAGHPTDYGYLWWLMPLDGSGSTAATENVIWVASGAQGQWLFVVPRHDLIVAVAGSSDARFTAPIDIVYNEIIPALRSP